MAMVIALAEFPLLRAQGGLGAEIVVVVLGEVVVVAVIVVRGGFVVHAGGVGRGAGGGEGGRILVEVLVSVAGGWVEAARGVAFVTSEGPALGRGRCAAEGSILGVGRGRESFVVSRVRGSALGADLLALAVVLGRYGRIGSAATGTTGSSLRL
jgi:hypothetical protein